VREGCFHCVFCSTSLISSSSPISSVEEFLSFALFCQYRSVEVVLFVLLATEKYGRSCKENSGGARRSTGAD
jgi:hypothetical protein